MALRGWSRQGTGGQALDLNRMAPGAVSVREVWRCIDQDSQRVGRAHADHGGGRFVFGLQRAWMHGVDRAN